MTQCLECDDCFTCAELPGISTSVLQVAISHCKGDEEISWLCCTELELLDDSTVSCPENADVFNIGGSCDEDFPTKCNSQVSGSYILALPLDTRAFYLHTHDGKIAGNDDLNSAVCGGNQNQGGACADVSPVGTTHCTVKIDMVEDCGFVFPTRPVDGPGPSPTPVDPSPTPANPSPTPANPSPTRDPNSDPSFGGDPHLKSWSGEWFDYHAECDLLLMHAPKFDGTNNLDIHVRTTIQ